MVATKPISEKPSYISFKDWTVKQMALSSNVSERTIHNIITHEFTALSEAMFANETLEVSGWGKFIFLRNKAIKKVTRLHLLKKTYQNTVDNSEETDLRRKNAEYKIISVQKTIDFLELKLKQNETK